MLNMSENKVIQGTIHGMQSRDTSIQNSAFLTSQMLTEGSAGKKPTVT